MDIKYSVNNMDKYLVDINNYHNMDVPNDTNIPDISYEKFSGFRGVRTQSIG